MNIKFSPGYIAATIALVSVLAFSIAATSRHATPATKLSPTAAPAIGPARLTPSGPRQYFVAINASASNSFQLGYSIYLIKRLAGMIDPSDWISVYRVDNVSRRIADGRAPTDTDNFNADLIDKLQALSKETGTHSLAFWKDAAKAATSNRPLTLVFMTDGFEEGATPEEIRQLRSAGSVLAGSPNVRAVYLLGVNTKMQGLWQSVFGAMGSRFHMEGPVGRSTIDRIETAADKRD